MYINIYVSLQQLPLHALKPVWELLVKQCLKSILPSR